MWNLSEVSPDMAPQRLSLQATVPSVPGPNKERLVPSIGDSAAICRGVHVVEFCLEIRSVILPETHTCHKAAWVSLCQRG